MTAPEAIIAAIAGAINAETGYVYQPGDRLLADMAAEAYKAAAPLMEPEGYEPFIASEGWREEAEVRLVPESAVAEAVAAERARCVNLARQVKAAYPVTPKPGIAWQPEYESAFPFADYLEDTP